jgi:hypothetical protein
VEGLEFAILLSRREKVRGSCEVEYLAGFLVIVTIVIEIFEFLFLTLVYRDGSDSSSSGENRGMLGERERRGSPKTMRDCRLAFCYFKDLTVIILDFYFYLFASSYTSIIFPAETKFKVGAWRTIFRSRVE